MPQSQPTTPGINEPTQADLQFPSNPFAGRRQNTTADFRPPPVQQAPSSASSIGRYATARLGANSQVRPDPDRNNTAPSRIHRLNSTRTARTANNLHNVEQQLSRPEKKLDQTVEIENEYFKLNPWYNRQKEKPVFGLASPLPRTVRRGMWWGRGDLRKELENVDENDEDGIARHDGLDFANAKDLDDDSEDAVTRCHLQRSKTSRTANVDHEDSDETLHNSRQYHSRHDGQSRAPVNEHGLDYSNASGQPQHFGMQDGLPPLQELDSSETTKSQKEEAETQQREHDAEQDYYNRYRNPIARLRAQYPQAPAEFLATFVYLLLGLCCNLSVATSGQSTGSFETQAWGWGFAVMIGIYMAGGVSGAHLSPTISISLAVYRGFPWRMAAVYIAMQLLAGLAAGGVAYGLYKDAIMSIDPGKTLDGTGSALFPKGPQFSTATGFLNDFVYMAVWVATAFALGDDQNSPPGQGMTALIFGLSGFVTMVALGYNTGLGISPARDIGPRLVGYWAGYKDAFRDGYWAYGPWCASILGALFGGLMYDLCIFVGGESPVNYRWPRPGDIKWRARNTKKKAKEVIDHLV